MVDQGSGTTATSRCRIQVFVSSLRTVRRDRSSVDVFGNATSSTVDRAVWMRERPWVDVFSTARRYRRLSRGVGRTADVRSRSPLGKSSSVYKYRPVNRRCAVVALVPLVFRCRTGWWRHSTRFHHRLSMFSLWFHRSLRRVQITQPRLGVSGLNHDPNVRDYNSSR